MARSMGESAGWRLVRIAGLGGVSCLGAGVMGDNTAQIGINPSFAGGTGPVSLLESRPGAIELSASTTGGASSAGSARCFVDDGVVEVSGAGSGSLTCVTRGTFRDTITVTAPGVPTGTPGTLTFTVIVEGELEASSGSSRASWSIAADIGGGATDLRGGGDYYSPIFPDPRYRGTPFGTFTATVPFGFGMPAQMYVQLEGSVAVAIHSSGPGDGAFGEPLRARWGGISGVSVNGVPVGSFSVSSVTGTNWAEPYNGCPADVNGDGFLDFFDYDDFVVAFESGAGDADFNNDGFVDFFDYDDFVAAFEAGC